MLQGYSHILTGQQWMRFWRWRQPLDTIKSSLRRKASSPTVLYGRLSLVCNAPEVNELLVPSVLVTIRDWPSSRDPFEIVTAPAAVCQ